jgi:hypothetical protein
VIQLRLDHGTHGTWTVKDLLNLFQSPTGSLRIAVCGLVNRRDR